MALTRASAGSLRSAVEQIRLLGVRGRGAASIAACDAASAADIAVLRFWSRRFRVASRLLRRLAHSGAMASLRDSRAEAAP